MKKLKIIIWDFDGVIVDSRELSLELNQKQYENVTEESQRDLCSGNIYIEVRKLKKKNFSEDEKEDFLKNSYFPRKMELIPVPGISEIIEKLSKEYSMVINSSAREEPLSAYLIKHNLPFYFKKIYGKETSKSKEEKFKLILKEFGVEADECLFITDTIGDVHEAMAVKIKSIGVLWGYQRRKHFTSCEEEIILVEKPVELIDLIKKFKN